MKQLLFAVLAILLFVNITLNGQIKPSIEKLKPNPSLLFKKDIKEIDYIGNYPSGKWGTWTEKLQGIANDDNNWFCTQLKTLWKIPIEIDFERTKNLKPTSTNGVLKCKMPDVLLTKGYWHFGDPDVHDGYIFIPIEGDNDMTPVLGVFKASNLEFIDYALLSGRTRFGWCTIHPNGDLFTSHNKINDDYPLYVYSIDWRKLKEKKELYV